MSDDASSINSEYYRLKGYKKMPRRQYLNRSKRSSSNSSDSRTLSNQRKKDRLHSSFKYTETVDPKILLKSTNSRMRTLLQKRLDHERSTKNRVKYDVNRNIAHILQSSQKKKVTNL